jgi:hypothetical protein
VPRVPGQRRPAPRTVAWVVVPAGARRCVRCPACAAHPGRLLVTPEVMLTWLFLHWQRSPNCFV